jgi:hypothetical protein
MGEGNSREDERVFKSVTIFPVYFIMHHQPVIHAFFQPGDGRFDFTPD